MTSNDTCDGYKVVSSFYPPEFVYKVERYSRYQTFEEVPSIEPQLEEEDANRLAKEYSLRYMIRTQVARVRVDPDE